MLHSLGERVKKCTSALYNDRRDTFVPGREQANMEVHEKRLLSELE